MVPVAGHHLAHVLDGEILPGRVPDVLPPGYLLEDQQSDLVGPVEELRVLRVVRGTHDVDPELELEDVRVSGLQPVRRGPPDVRIGSCRLRPRNFNGWPLR